MALYSTRHYRETKLLWLDHLAREFSWKNFYSWSQKFLILALLHHEICREHSRFNVKTANVLYYITPLIAIYMITIQAPTWSLPTLCKAPLLHNSTWSLPILHDRCLHYIWLATNIIIVYTLIRRLCYVIIGHTMKRCLCYVIIVNTTIMHCNVYMHDYMNKCL